MQQIQNIISREINPLDVAVISVGRIEGGTRYNIIAEECVLEGTCRSLKEDTRALLEKRLKDTVDFTCGLAGATGALTYERGYSALRNHPEMAALVKMTRHSLFAEGAVIDVEEPTMGEEDFSFFLEHIPGAFFSLGVGKGQDNYPLHNSKFDVDEDILWRASAMICQLLANAAQSSSM
jgi:amidohydrolase